MRGRVECEEADVAGSFEGVEMVAHHRLTLSSTARVGGKVREETGGRGTGERGGEMASERGGGEETDRVAAMWKET